MGRWIALRGRLLAGLGVIAVVVSGCTSSIAHATAPQVHETWVQNVSTTSAVLHARVDSGTPPTTYRFDYIPEAAFQANELAGKDGFSGAAKVPQPEGNPGKGSDQPVSQKADGLQQETSYRYRVVVHNTEGTALGPARRLTTKGPGGPLALLDGRAWEMASPVEKNGGEIQPPGGVSGGGVFQAASPGGAVTFSSMSSFGTGGAGAPAASQYVSRRGSGGWTVENVTAPLSAGGYGEEPDGVPYQLFSSDLSAGLLSAPGYPPLAGTAAPAGYRNYYLRGSAGGYTALVTYADVAGLEIPPQRFELGFAGATPDLSHVVLSTCAALSSDAVEVPGAEEGCDPQQPNLYEWSAAGLRLLNVLPGDSVGTPPARLAAPSEAISSDGSRVDWTDGADLYLSEEGAPTVQVDEAVGGGGAFQTAATDGSVVLFTKEGRLYRYDAVAGTTTNLTPAGGVVGVLGASADGLSVYYLAASGLFLSRGGTSTPVATAADPSNFPPSTGTARVSDDGNRLAFVSSAELLETFDNTEASGHPATEVYLYDVGGGPPRCVSCNPTGERPRGSSTLPGASSNGQGEDATRAYKPRALTAGGNRLFFESRDALVPADVNGEGQDVYEWEAGGIGTCALPHGCLQLVSAGARGDSSFVDASAGGADVFFLTDDSLVKTDPGSADLYDAREGGGFAEPPAAFVCEEDACQPLPSPPDDPGPGTLVAGPGNPPVHFPRKHKKKRHRKHHAGRRSHR